MNDTLNAIKERVAVGNARASEHGLQELKDDGIDISDVFAGVAKAITIEESPNYFKGPCVLCLQYDGGGKPIHVLWGMSLQSPDWATIITAYRPSPKVWLDNLATRRKR